MNYWAKVSIAAAVAGGLIGLYFFDIRQSEKKEEAQKTESRALSFESVKVRRIALENSSGKFVFERDSEKGDWRFAETASKARVDQDTVGTLLSGLEGLTVSLDVPDTEKAVKGDAGKSAEFGLDKPKIKVELTLADKAIGMLQIGSDMDIGTKSGERFEAVSAYASSSSRGSVFVLSNASLANLKKGFNEFRTKQAADFKTDDVVTISVRGEDGKALLLAKGDKDWNVKAPRELLADSNNVSVFLNTLSGLKVEQVTEPEMLASERMGALGLDKPAGVVELKGAGDKVLQTFRFGKAGESLYVTMVDGAVGTVDKGRWKDMVPDLLFFRDKRVLRDVALADVNRIRTQSGKIFQKEGDAWYLAGGVGESLATASKPSGAADSKNTVQSTPTPAQKAANADALALFNEWEFMTAEQVLEGGEATKLSALGLDKPQHRFWLESSDPKRPSEEILVGNKVPKMDRLVYVKRANRETVFAVPASWLDKLTALDGGKVGEKK